MEDLSWWSDIMKTTASRKATTSRKAARKSNVDQSSYPWAAQDWTWAEPAYDTFALTLAAEIIYTSIATPGQTKAIYTDGSVSGVMLQATVCPKAREWFERV